MPQPPADLLPPLIAALRSQLGADLVETHASWVLVGAERAWKIKKPITLPFLDYASLEQRRQACAEEVRLNRRLAAALYLDAVPIGGTPTQPQLGITPAIEWAVVMRRFDDTQRLDRLCARGELTLAAIDELAASITAFQADAAVAPADSRFGEPAQVLAPALENFVELRQLLPATAQPIVEQLATWTADEFARRRADMAQRKEQGCIREGHGDLHLGNLVLIAGVVTPFDGIEFNADLRWIDVASEVAFTWVDLLDHRQPGLAARWLNAWREASGDTAAFAVMRFYAVYRALVRAKVASIRATQENDAGQRDTDLALAADYLQLARQCAASPAPSLSITVGLSGSGKSRASAAWLAADQHGACLRLRSDVERKRLHGLAPLATSGSGVATGIYSQEATDATYAHLAEEAARLLDHGWSVVVDAAFLRRRERQAFRQLAAKHGASFGIIHCQAPLDELKRRLRQRHGDASEATPAVLEQQLEWFEALDAEEETCVIARDGTGT